MKHIFLILIATVTLFANQSIALDPDTQKLDNFNISFLKDKKNSINFDTI